MITFLLTLFCLFLGALIIMFLAGIAWGIGAIFSLAKIGFIALIIWVIVKAASDALR